jgi:dipeptidyl aminopeptidase/acylaminoacyl peptidase
MGQESSFGIQRWGLLLAAVGAVVLGLVLPAMSSASMLGLNGRIAFTKSVETGELDFEAAVWAMNPDGSAATRLTTGVDASDGAYSPDGSRLTFDRYNEVWIAAADGSGARALFVGTEQETTKTRWVANYKDPEKATVYPWVKIEEDREARDTRSEPSFSPSGTALAVVHYSGTFVFTHVCSVPADKSTSCNGVYNGYDADCEDCGSSIDSIDASSGATLATLVPRTSGVYLSAPTYSSGGALAYAREAENEDGNQVLSLAAPGAAPVVLASGEGISAPDFSPDGSRIVFASGQHTLGIVAAAGGPLATIPIPPPLPTDKLWIARSPIWSPDGSLIAFANLGAPGTGGLESYRDGGVFLIRPDGTGLAQIQGEAAVPSAWQPIPLVAARAGKGKKKARFSKKGVAVVGTVVCGSTPCSLSATVRKLKVGKKRFSVKAIVPGSLLPGATAQLKVKVKGKALKALKAKHGGKLKLSLAVADTGVAQTLRFTPKLLPPKQHQGKKKK